MNLRKSYDFRCSFKVGSILEQRLAIEPNIKLLCASKDRQFPPPPPSPQTFSFERFVLRARAIVQLQGAT